MTDTMDTRPARRSRKARPLGGITRIPGKRGDSFRVKIDLRDLPRVDGKRPTVSQTFRTRDEAEAALRQLRDQAKKGIRVDENVTLAEWATRWLADTIAPDVANRTYERYGELLNHYVLPSLGQKKLRKVQPADVESLYQRLALSGRRRAKEGDGQRGLSAQTITHVHRVLSQCLKDAMRLRHIDENPCSVVRRPRKNRRVAATAAGEATAPKVKMKILARADLTRLLEGCDAATSKSLPCPLVRLALDSGARRGELLALRWSDINLDGRQVRIERAVEETSAYGIAIKPEPKNESSRRAVTISHSTADALRAEWKRQAEMQLRLGRRIADDALVFPRSPMEPRAPLRPREVSKAFGRAATVLGFPGLRLHDLRHNCASHMLSAGRSVPDVARHLGHSTPAITMSVYAHAIPRQEAGTGLLDEWTATKAT